MSINQKERELKKLQRDFSNFLYTIDERLELDCQKSLDDTINTGINFENKTEKENYFIHLISNTLKR